MSEEKSPFWDLDNPQDLAILFNTYWWVKGGTEFRKWANTYKTVKWPYRQTVTNSDLQELLALTEHVGALIKKQLEAKKYLEEKYDTQQ